MPLRRVLVLLIVVAAVVLAVVYYRKRAAERAAAEDLRPEGDFVVVCPSFGYGGTIPAEYTADGRDASPPLTWDGVPDGTVTFALLMEDTDAPLGTFVHWLMCEIPGKVRALPGDVPRTEIVVGSASGVQGNNSARRLGYSGPAPPPGKAHRYYFRLYALDTTIEMPGSFTRNQLRAAMKGHVLGEAVLMGRYQRGSE